VKSYREIDSRGVVQPVLLFLRLKPDLHKRLFANPRLFSAAISTDLLVPNVGTFGVFRRAVLTDVDKTSVRQRNKPSMRVETLAVLAATWPHVLAVELILMDWMTKDNLFYGNALQVWECPASQQ